VAETLQLGNEPAGVCGAVAFVEPVRAEVTVGLIPIEHVVDADQDAVRDRNRGPFLAAPGSDPGEPRGQIGVFGPGHRVRGFDQHGGQPLVAVAASRLGRVYRRTRASPVPVRPRRPDVPRTGTRTCRRRLCDTRSHIARELMD
jgi:hypothetical protein